MNLSSHVEERLLHGHKLNSIIEAGLVEDFVKTTRIVTLIECIEKFGAEDHLQALFIYKTARFPVHSSIDINLESIIPVDANFKCEIDSNTEKGSDVLLKITHDKIRLLFELPFSQQTNSFVSDVMKAVDAFTKRKGIVPEFHWTKPYYDAISLNGQSTSVSQSSSRENSLFYVNVNEDSNSLKKWDSSKSLQSNRSPDLKMNRHSIALGVTPTPIAARESHIRHQMSLREEAYTDIENVTVFVGTWNVNGQYPSVGLGEWLACDETPPDIYAIAFQELDMNTEVFIFNVTSREQEWLNAVLNGVHPRAKYKKVRLVRLIGIMLIVLVQEKHLAYVRNVAVDTVGTGILNKLGNKGAASIRLDFYNTSIVFVNAHLAAHVEEVERRNEDYDCILFRTAFTPNVISGPPKSIRDHDHIYFFGDMNYRINPGDYDIRNLASRNEFKILLENDQLIEQKNLKRIFNHFHESEIKFKPSYKYDLNSDAWDSSEKARQPSWCDRILWRGEHIFQTQYRSHPQLRISDHKPVSAAFVAGIKVIDASKYRKIYEEVMKKLDKLENEFLPLVSVDTTEIIFTTPVKFLHPQTKELIIANTGQVPVQFEFISKFSESTYCKPWLSIRPYTDFLMPGDKCEVELEVLVDKYTAHNLNCGAEKLYDILVLHLDGGKDIFITITGDYERSCFGASLNCLVHMNKPFKTYSVAEIIDLESEKPKNQVDLPYAVPKELWFLVDHLNTYGLDQEGLFITPGLHKEIMEIREALDEGMPGDKLPGGIHSVAETLLLFLEALGDPIVPYNFFQKALDSIANFYLCKQVIDSLPERHRNVFNYIIFFLKDVLTHSEKNGLDPKTIAHVFGIILLREASSVKMNAKSISSANERRKQTFVHHFLVND